MDPPQEAVYASIVQGEAVITRIISMSMIEIRKMEYEIYLMLQYDKLGRYLVCT